MVKEQSSDSDSSSHSSNSSFSNLSFSSLNSSNSHKAKRKRRTKKSNTTRVLGDFRFEKYNGFSDPIIWFKGFENKAELHELFLRENKKILKNELYFYLIDKAREFFEDENLMKSEYKSMKRSILKRFKKDSRKASYNIAMIKMRHNESI